MDTYLNEKFDQRSNILEKKNLNQYFQIMAH
jgi:hypothetical protein